MPACRRAERPLPRPIPFALADWPCCLPLSTPPICPELLACLQCCELCGVVAHGGCFKAVPHNCRLLTLGPPAQPAGSTASASAWSGGGAGADGHRAKGEAEGGAHSAVCGSDLFLAMSLPLPLPLPHDWRPAGTTLDLILPPAVRSGRVKKRGTPGLGFGPVPSPSVYRCYASHAPRASTRTLCLRV